MNFNIFKQAVARQFSLMQSRNLFRTQVDKDLLWDTYLSSFPAGSNPMYQERTEHDCNSCKQFIRTMGNVVAIIDGDLVSIWDGPVDDPNYQVVAAAMATLVKSAPIENIFLHCAPSAGTAKNFTSCLENVVTWEHFHVQLPRGKHGEKNFVMPQDRIPTKLSEMRSLYDVLYRSLSELTLDSIDTVLELIAQNSLYRGTEHRATLQRFRALKQEFQALPLPQQTTAVWLMIQHVPGSVAKIRNTSIGTLLTHLSEGMALEAAVRAFETLVAPMNYKRPTALVTESMVKKAKATVEELGLTTALERRYATLADIKITDVLFTNRASRGVITDDPFTHIANATPTYKQHLEKVEAIPIERFLTDIVPHITTMELLVENRHAGNLVSLIAPVDATARPLFKWENNFSWSYNGDVTDSIKARVQKAGGKTKGDLLCRLSWNNTDDLDLHMCEPNNNEINYVAKHSRYTGGCLDVDMNAAGETREPVENIYYTSRYTMLPGRYKLYVRNYFTRETTNKGFEVEIDLMGTLYHFACPRPLKLYEDVPVAEFNYGFDGKLTLLTALSYTAISKALWNIQTEQFQPVNILCLSPNYWGEEHGTGNKHYFFMLNGCKNDGSARGFYNEFLHAELDQHRKVLELVGSKMRTQDSENQLSGLGFSSTQHNDVLCRVTGNFTRTIKLVF